MQIDDQRKSTLFYIAGLGLTRDPYMMVTVTNMWATVGRSQFHLPTDKAQVLRGRIGLVMPELESLVERLASVKKDLKGTKFPTRRARAIRRSMSPARGATGSACMRPTRNGSALTGSACPMSSSM